MKTSTSLLLRLRQPSDREAWSRFVRLYGPLIYRWAIQAGLPKREAEDFVQDVMTLLVQKLPNFHYDRSKSFRSWLKTVTLNKWRERGRRQSIPSVNLTESGLQQVPEPNEHFWDTEYQREVLENAMELLKDGFQPATWAACQKYMRGEGTPEQLATEYGISPWTIYSAKSRLLKRLREELRGLLD